MDDEQARRIAEQIAQGHAFQDHVLDNDEFPEIRTREEFAQLIREVLTDGSSSVKLLTHGREAYWSEVHRTIVILDSSNEDAGTAFRPFRGRAYFRGLI
ncbi:MAG TPA: hypothetical protein VKT75_05370 [Acidobacteriaceae bacterium]|nr:hypothetical protein [Acidobacteriaceae bacterium]